MGLVDLRRLVRKAGAGWLGWRCTSPQSLRARAKLSLVQPCHHIPTTAPSIVVVSPQTVGGVIDPDERYALIGF